MNNDPFIFRKATIKDSNDIYKLYKTVAKTPGSLDRDESEINKQYVESFTLRALKSNSQFIVTDPNKEHRTIAELHCLKPEPKAFNHVLIDLTMAINPAYHGMGIEEKLCYIFLANISSNRSDIMKIELSVRESDKQSIGLFEKIGFKQEGRLEKKYRTSKNNYEAVISMAWFNPKYRRVE